MLNPPKLIEARAFTTHFNGLAREIITDIGITLPFDPRTEISLNDKRIHQTKALWDTGATNSAITKNIVTALNLKPIGQAEVHHANGKSLVNVYLVNIYLPNKFAIQYVRVTECSNTTGSFDVLIGMDIITLGDFSMTNVNGLTTISFRIPSLEKIDYVKKIDAQHTPIRV